MKRTISVVAAPLAASLLVLGGGCRRETLEDRIDKLPPLPASLADTLDPKTHATRVPASFPAPEKAPGPVLAPCCGISDFKTLKVNYSYTKCAPLRDFIVVSLDGVMALEAASSPSPGAGPPGVKFYRLGERSARSVLDTTVCVTSEGPWDASFREDRNCNGYTPQDSLLITAFGDPILFAWNGGTPNHPAGIGLVSCRQVANLQAPCNALSGCQCLSSSCPADQPCECTLQW